MDVAIDVAAADLFADLVCLTEAAALVLTLRFLIGLAAAAAARGAARFFFVSAAGLDATAGGEKKNFFLADAAGFNAPAGMERKSRTFDGGSLEFEVTGAVEKPGAADAVAVDTDGAAAFAGLVGVEVADRFLVGAVALVGGNGMPPDLIASVSIFAMISFERFLEEPSMWRISFELKCCMKTGAAGCCPPSSTLRRCHSCAAGWSATGFDGVEDESWSLDGGALAGGASAKVTRLKRRPSPATRSVLLGPSSPQSAAAGDGSIVQDTSIISNSFASRLNNGLLRVAAASLADAPAAGSSKSRRFQSGFLAGTGASTGSETTGCSSSQAESGSLAVLNISSVLIGWEVSVSCQGFLAGGERPQSCSSWHQPARHLASVNTNGAEHSLHSPLPVGKLTMTASLPATLARPGAKTCSTCVTMPCSKAPPPGVSLKIEPSSQHSTLPDAGSMPARSSAARPDAVRAGAPGCCDLCCSAIASRRSNATVATA